MCNAVAAAVLGDATKAKYVPLSAQQRFLALQSGEIDMLVRNSTITLRARCRPRHPVCRRQFL